MSSASSTPSAAEAEKDAGNRAYQKGEFANAVSHYSRAIALDVHNHVLYSNRSIAALKAGDAHAALHDAIVCWLLDSSFAKGAVRVGMALNALHRTQDALAFYTFCMYASPWLYAPGSNPTARSMLASIRSETAKLHALRLYAPHFETAIFLDSVVGSCTRAVRLFAANRTSIVYWLSHACSPAQRRKLASTHVHSSKAAVQDFCERLFAQPQRLSDALELLDCLCFLSFWMQVQGVPASTVLLSPQYTLDHPEVLHPLEPLLRMQTSEMLDMHSIAEVFETLANVVLSVHSALNPPFKQGQTPSSSSSSTGNSPVSVGEPGTDHLFVPLLSLPSQPALKQKVESSRCVESLSRLSMHALSAAWILETEGPRAIVRELLRSQDWLVSLAEKVEQELRTTSLVCEDTSAEKMSLYSVYPHIWSSHYVVLGGDPTAPIESAFRIIGNVFAHGAVRKASKKLPNDWAELMGRLFDTPGYEFSLLSARAVANIANSASAPILLKHSRHLIRITIQNITEFRHLRFTRHHNYEDGRRNQPSRREIVREMWQPQSIKYWRHYTEYTGAVEALREQTARELLRAVFGFAQLDDPAVYSLIAQYGLKQAVEDLGWTYPIKRNSQSHNSKSSSLLHELKNLRPVASLMSKQDGKGKSDNQHVLTSLGRGGQCYSYCISTGRSYVIHSFRGELVSEGAGTVAAEDYFGVELPNGHILTQLHSVPIADVVVALEKTLSSSCASHETILLHNPYADEVPSHPFYDRLGYAPPLLCYAPFARAVSARLLIMAEFARLNKMSANHNYLSALYVVSRRAWHMHRLSRLPPFRPRIASCRDLLMLATQLHGAQPDMKAQNLENLCLQAFLRVYLGDGRMLLEDSAKDSLLRAIIAAWLKFSGKHSVTSFDNGIETRALVEEMQSLDRIVFFEAGRWLLAAGGMPIDDYLADKPQDEKPKGDERKRGKKRDVDQAAAAASHSSGSSSSAPGVPSTTAGTSGHAAADSPPSPEETYDALPPLVADPESAGLVGTAAVAAAAAAAFHQSHVASMEEYVQERISMVLEDHPEFLEELRERFLGMGEQL